MYSSASKQPFVLYCRINDEIEKPNANVLQKYINIFMGIPMIDTPNTHIVIISIMFDRKAFLKLFK